MQAQETPTLPTIESLKGQLVQGVVDEVYQFNGEVFARTHTLVRGQRIGKTYLVRNGQLFNISTVQHVALLQRGDCDPAPVPVIPNVSTTSTSTGEVVEAPAPHITRNGKPQSVTHADILVIGAMCEEGTFHPMLTFREEEQDEARRRLFELRGWLGKGLFSPAINAFEIKAFDIFDYLYAEANRPKD